MPNKEYHSFGNWAQEQAASAGGSIPAGLAADYVITRHLQEH